MTFGHVDCKCGHGREKHPHGLACFNTPKGEVAFCPCARYRPNLGGLTDTERLDFILAYWKAGNFSRLAYDGSRSALDDAIETLIECAGCTHPRGLHPGGGECYTETTPGSCERCECRAFVWPTP
jgi:hypothetical protein